MCRLRERAPHGRADATFTPYFSCVLHGAAPRADCKCVYYVGKKPDRRALYKEHVETLTFNVLVTTYEFAMRDATELSKARFSSRRWTFGLRLMQGSVAVADAVCWRDGLRRVRAGAGLCRRLCVVSFPA